MFVLFVVCEAVQYIGSISSNAVDYPGLFGHFLYMARYSMMHMLARWSGLNLLEMQEKYGLQFY